MIVILDNGHGRQTFGKMSPDGSIKEYAYARKITKSVKEKLDEIGINSVILVPEEDDISLRERCKRANEIYKENNKQAILVSEHLNAAGNGSQWMSARGWSVFVSKNASQNSKDLAECFADAANEVGVKIRREYPDRGYWVQNLAICRDTYCPAILLENFFQDNKDDVEFLLSQEGFDTVVNISVQGILKYINNNGNE